MTGNYCGEATGVDTQTSITAETVLGGDGPLIQQ